MGAECGDGQGGDSSLGEGKDDVGKVTREGQEGKETCEEGVWLQGSRGDRC